MKKYKKPLNRSISIGCLSFILSLCVVLSIVNYISFYRALYERYNNYLSDILHHIEYKIDTDDLYECTVSGQPSENYDEVQALMNDMLDTGSLHYLYIITPLDVQKEHTCFTVMTGMTRDERENHYDEQNLLGDVFDDFSPEIVQTFVDAMKNPGKITFAKDRESTVWGTDYTAMLPLTTSDGNTFTVLAADISVDEIYRTLWRHTFGNIALIILIGLLFSFIFIFWSKFNITLPIEQLEHSVVEFAETSHGQNDPSRLVYNQPDIHTANEVESLSDAVTQMSGDIRNYAKNIVEAESKISDLKQSTEKLGEIAFQDALTHVKNKAAYDLAVQGLNEKIKSGKAKFALVMIDLNSLKKINDEYGHEKGNIYITGSCSIICTIYTHSPVFRIGGDEFVVILEKVDYNFREELLEALNATVKGCALKTEAEPWERFSMAAGMAVYDSAQDSDADSVFKRADKIMYENKQAYKAAILEV